MGLTASDLVDQDTNLWLITGQNLTVTPREFLKMFLDIDSAIFFCASFCLITFIFPVQPDALLPWWMKLAGFSIFLVLIPAVYFAQVMIVAWVSSRFPRFFMFEPLLLLVTAVVIELVDINVYPLIFGNAWAVWGTDLSFATQVVGTFGLLLALHIIFCVFVLPRKSNLRIWSSAAAISVPGHMIDAPTTGNEANFLSMGGPVGQTKADQIDRKTVPQRPEGPAVAANVEMIEINGSALSITSILAFAAEEHYIRLWTDDDREIYFRQSFSGLSKRMCETDGFSPRRGIWVSFRNIREIQRDDKGKLIIIPQKGPLTVVPKAKASEVKKIILKQTTLA